MTERRQFRRTGVWAMLGALALQCVMSGVAQAQQKTGPQADGSVIRLIVNISGSLSFPALIIKKFGLDKAHNFELETIPAATMPASMTIIRSKAADIGAWNWPDIARFSKGDTKLKVFAPEMKWANTIITPAASNIQSLKDVKGRKFGLIARTGLDWVVIRAYAKAKLGFDMETDVTMQEGAIQILRGLVEQNQLDATLMYSDYTPGMLATGKYRQIAAIRDLVAELGIADAPYILFAARADYAASNPANLKAFAAAYQEAVTIMQTRDDVWTDLAAALKITDPDVIPKFREQTRPLFVGSFSPTAMSDLKATFKILYDTAGPSVMGLDSIPDDFIPLESAP